MRDSKRIKQILEKLEEFWNNNPNMRLGQIISNCVRAYDGRLNCDPFYLEDEDLIDGLEKLDSYLH